MPIKFNPENKPSKKLYDGVAPNLTPADRLWLEKNKMEITGLNQPLGFSLPIEIVKQISAETKPLFDEIDRLNNEFIDLCGQLNLAKYRGESDDRLQVIDNEIRNKMKEIIASSKKLEQQSPKIAEEVRLQLRLHEIYTELIAKTKDSKKIKN